MFQLIYNHLSCVIILLSTIIAGCPIATVNTPDAKLAVQPESMIGKYYMDDKLAGVPHRIDYEITHSGNDKFPFQIKSESAPQEEGPKFQIYQIGKNKLVFADSTSPDMKKKGTRQLGVAKLTVTKTQLVFGMLNPKFFDKNPDAIPGMSKTIGGLGDGNILLNASPKQLELFFKLHEDTDSLFVTDEPLLLHRKK